MECPGARRLLFLDRHPNNMDAAMVSEISNFRELAQDLDRSK